MHLDIVNIGNSQGIRLPKALLAQCEFTQSVEVTIEDGKMVLSKPVTVKENPRQGWEEAFVAARAAGGVDAQPWPHFNNDWDETDWEW